MTYRILAIAFASLAGACASTPSTQQGNGAERAFIEESAIDVPVRIAGGELINIMRESQLALGVNAFYRLAAHPDASLDLFIYPAGNLPKALGAQRVQEEFIISLDVARRIGTFQDLVIGSQEAFAIPLVGAEPLTGHKTTLSMRRNAQPLDSRAWVAFRQNYAFKVRLSVPAGDSAWLDGEGDAIARELLGRARASNLGGCATVNLMTIQTLPPGQPGMLDPVSEDGRVILLVSSMDEAAIKQAVSTSVARVQANGCFAHRLPDVEEGSRRFVLRFKPGDWGPADE